MLSEREKALLSGPNFLYIATVNEDGSPQVSPVWVEVEDDLVVINTARGRVKERNMSRNKHVALSLYDQANPYDVVSFAGEVVEMNEEGASRHIDSLSKKYLGRDEYPYHEPGEKRVKIKIKKVA